MFTDQNYFLVNYIVSSPFTKSNSSVPGANYRFQKNIYSWTDANNIYMKIDNMPSPSSQQILVFLQLIFFFIWLTPVWNCLQVLSRTLNQFADCTTKLIYCITWFLYSRVNGFVLLPY